MTGFLLFAIAMIAARVPQPRLCVGAFAGTYLACLLAVIHTALTKPGDGFTGGRAWLVALALILGAKGAGLVIRYTLVEAFRVPSASNVPTLLVGDHIFVKKGHGTVARGDVIVFRYPVDPSTDYIKRVVAIGGDTIEVKNGVPSINGMPLAHRDRRPLLLPGRIAPPVEGAQDARWRARPTPAARTRSCSVRLPRAGLRAHRRAHGRGVRAGRQPRQQQGLAEVGYRPRRADQGDGDGDLVVEVPNGAVRWSRVGHGIE